MPFGAKAGSFMVQQLNKLQIKAEILTLLSLFQKNIDLLGSEEHLQVLLEQEDKDTILKILIKELIKSNEQKAVLVCFLLLRLCEKEQLETELWAILKNRLLNDVTKTIALDLLKDLGNKVEYEKLEDYFENPDDVVDADTKRLLHIAIVNPEAQIDFLDFLNSLSAKDKEILVQSLGDDYSSDDLANILNPLFLYNPVSDLGKISAQILGNTKSQLALHSLTEALDFVDDEETISLIKKNISTLKLAGVREDNAIEFYKNILQSKPYKSFTSYPDGHGNQAVIFSRQRENESIQLVAAVINDRWGIVDCFGFNEISESEFNRIVDKFYNKDEHIYINSSVLKNILHTAEILTRKTGGELSYEYICWKTLLSDIQSEPVPVDLILKAKFMSKPLPQEQLEEIYAFDFIQRWFLDTDYNSQFAELITALNKKIASDNFDIDLDLVVADVTADIFADDEKNLLDKRILMSAYLKYLSSDNYSTQLLYSLYYDEDMKLKLAENIIRKSIYEYYVGLKFKQKEHNKTSNIFALKNKPKKHELSVVQVEAVIRIIESLWVR